MIKKIVVFGNPEIAANIFSEINFPQVKIVAAVCSPDKKIGRGQKINFCPVKIWAKQKNIPVFQPQIIDQNFAAKLKNLGAEIGMVIAFGKIFSSQFLENFSLFNLHFSLLPKFRGASPVQSAILAGEKISGVSLFKIISKLDAGDVFSQKKIEISNKFASEIFMEMKNISIQILQDFLQKFSNNQKIEIFPQIGQPTFCQKISKKDGEIIPEKISAEIFLRKIRAFQPWPGIFLNFKNKKIKIFQTKIAKISILPGEKKFIEKKFLIGCCDKTLEILQLQVPGKKIISGADFFCQNFKK